MSDANLTVKIINRSDTSANWNSINPVLSKGEIATELDTNKIKVGDGITTWKNLPYVNPDVDLSNYVQKDVVYNSSDNSNGIEVSLSGNIENPAIDLTVNTGTITKDNNNVVTGGVVYTAIQDAITKLSGGMRIRGTIGTSGTISSLPSSAEVGDTYIVVTDGNYNNQAATKGDLFSYYVDSTGAKNWLYIPSGDDIEDTWRSVKVNGTQILDNGNAGDALDFKAGSGISLTTGPGNGVVTVNANSVSTTTNGIVPSSVQNGILANASTGTSPEWFNFITIDGGNASTTIWGTITKKS